MFEWEFELLEIINNRGGEACLPEIYEELEARPETEKGLHKAINGRRPGYQHRAQRYISNLCQKGYLVRQRRGCYSLTHQGKQHFLIELGYRAPESPVLARERTRKSVVVPVEIEALDEGGYLATCSAIQGCLAEGDTVGESLENLEDAARAILELRTKEGWGMPPGLEEYKRAIVLKAQLVVPLPE